jgi:glycosyltransferase involved in cell wall biosynthesis
METAEEQAARPHDPGEELRVALLCSGLGRVARGYERFFHELATALRGRVSARVFAGRLPPDLTGATVPCLPRMTLTRLGLTPERAYYWEQLSFGAALLPHLIAFRPHLVHVSDPALTNLLLRLRQLVPGGFRILFCNGGALSPIHYRRYDHVQLVTPWQLDEARRAGIPASQVDVVPHGVDTTRFQGLPDRAEARARLGLPDGLLAISVAALNASPKRLDYLIREFGRASTARWMLLCVGQPTSETPGLHHLATEVASGRILFRTAAPEQVPLYLAAADLFVLTRRSRGERNRALAVARFDWRVVTPAYLELYKAVAREGMP